jgi:excisionase family DNA binding protein
LECERTRTHPSISWRSVKEFSEEFSIAPSTVYKLAAAGNLPTLKIGGSVRIDRSSLLAVGLRDLLELRAMQARKRSPAGGRQARRERARAVLGDRR